MAGKSRRTDPSLKQKLFSCGYEFDFFQAVFLLNRIFSERKGVGEAAKPSHEVVRFSARAAMDFPASSIDSIYERQNGQTGMTVSFMGLTGPQGILPSSYTELVIAQNAAKSTALADFFDVFNHRLISLFYRAWAKHHFAVNYEREQSGIKGADRFTTYLFSLIGMGTVGLRDRLPIPDLALLRYAGLIAQRPHSASALRALLADFFDVPVEIDQMRGKWLPMGEANLSYLNEPGPHNQLGLGAIAGDAIWDVQSEFQIRLGPLGLESFVRFLPVGDACRVLRGLTQYFVDTHLSFTIQVLVKASEVPECRLTDEGLDAPRLGWIGWLKTDPFIHDADEAVFEASEAA